MFGWKNISITTQLTIVVGIMGFLIAGELIALRLSMSTLTAVRAFVGGEGAWSKAQKDAVFSLQRYALTRDERDYQEFLENLKIPEGDHRARVELTRPKPDLEIVRQGFIQGQIHPNDIDAMIALLQRFSRVSYLQQAIGYWTRGDEMIDRFRKLGETYHTAIASRTANPRMLAEATAQLHEINEVVTRQENGFSSSLAEGSRWLEHIVLTLLFVAALAVEMIGLTLTYRVTKRISRGLSELNRVAEKMGQGDFTAIQAPGSNDEIGTLTTSINKMGSLLDRSYKTLENRVNERTLELTRLATENAELYQEAKAALTSRDEFLSIASHELKTPLSAMYLQLQLMERYLNAPDGDQTPKFKLSLDRSLKQAQQLSVLINELLDLTRIRSGRLELVKSPCELRSILFDSLSNLASDIDRSKSKVSIKADTLIPGSFDRIRIGQVFTNLISNALKYGLGNPIEISLEISGSAAIFRVTDQGPGIPGDKHESIFQLFERATSDRGISGLGLGLYISRQIILAHNGSIHLKSAPGAGSTFIAEIPLAAA